MSRDVTATAVVIERLQEFDRVATVLEIPHSERLSILNMSDAAYSWIRDGTVTADQYIKPELLRRLNYALPLMRRMASNTKRTRLSDAGSPSGLHAA